MALAPAIQGAKRPSQLITWTDETGAPLDLSGAVITARIRNLSTGQIRDSNGTFVIVSPLNGSFRWDYSTEDVAEAGTYEVQFTASFPSEPSPARTIVTRWSVLRSL
jgi:hypothetical protein